MTHSVTIPGRTLAIICVCNNSDPNQSGTLYKIEPSDTIDEKYPNLCVHTHDTQCRCTRTEHLPLVVINFASDDVYLSKGETMGFMQIQSLEISEIMTRTSTEPSSVICEDDINEVLREQDGKFEEENIEKKFITSPADIEVHRKLNYRMPIYQMSNSRLSKTYVWNLLIYFPQILVI